MLNLGGRRSWRAGADCKSVGERLWGFESLAAHKFPKLILSGGNSIGRVTAFQAVGCGFESRLPLRHFGVFYALKCCFLLL